jgi:hypothetical protein
MTIMKLLPTLELDKEIDLISFIRNSIEKASYTTNNKKNFH